MNTSIVWANIFSEQLNCVSCRKYKKTNLYYFNGTPVNAADMTLQELEREYPSFDVWCSDCQVKKTWRVITEGRMERKKGAADLARMSAPRGTWKDHLEQVIEKGLLVTAEEFIKAAKGYPCFLCGVTYPDYVMDFHHMSNKSWSISKMKHNGHSVNAIIHEIEKCALLCGNCHRTIHYSSYVLPVRVWNFEDYKESILTTLKGTHS